MKRAIRRHHKRRMKKKAVKKYWWLNSVDAYKYADILAVCSCAMCCNPRKNPWASKKEQLTLQEQKELEKWNSWEFLY